MGLPPVEPRIYHITHIGNLQAIITIGALLSDAEMMARANVAASIGMPRIKQRRLELPVVTHPGLHVGACVPFYFCPRSIMLYVLHCANSDGLTYRGGQGPIVHFESKLRSVVAWANSANRRWAFTLSNASANYAEFRTDLRHLGDIDWGAVASNNFSSGNRSARGLPVKEGKQAEFLLEGDLPWSLIERIGVHSPEVAVQAHGVLSRAAHKPPVSVEPTWYF